MIIKQQSIKNSNDFDKSDLNYVMKCDESEEENQTNIRGLLKKMFSQQVIIYNELYLTGILCNDIASYSDFGITNEFSEEKYSEIIKNIDSKSYNISTLLYHLNELAEKNKEMIGQINRHLENSL